MRFRPFIVGLAVAATAIVGCGKDPMSSEDSMSTVDGMSPSPAARAVSAAPVAATAEHPLGLVSDAPRTFVVTIENVDAAAWRAAGVFDTPVGAAGPGPLLPGSSYEFSFVAGDGARLSFATMYVQSNDLFFAPDEGGIALFEGGVPVTGSVVDQVWLWDAGTEVNQAPGTGADQAPRQAGPDTGADEGGVVRPVADGFTYPDAADAIDVVIRATPEAGATRFTVAIVNLAGSPTPLAPGVCRGGSRPG